MNSSAQRIAESAMASPLTEQESDVMLMAALGYSDAVVARLMRISVDAVARHRSELCRKLGIGTEDGLAAMIAGILRHGSEAGERPLNVAGQAAEDSRPGVSRTA